MEMIKIVLADDHPVFRKGLKMLLREEDPRLDVICSCEDGEELLRTLETISTEPDLALLDIRMPRKDGLETAIELKRKYPGIKIIIITTFDEKYIVQGAINVGVDGFILKDSPMEEIAHVIEKIMGGEKYLAPQALDTLLSGQEEKNKYQGQINKLTIRQQEILQLLARGMRNPEMSEELCISERTIRNYVSQLYDTLDLHSRGEVIVWAREHGIV